MFSLYQALVHWKFWSLEILVTGNSQILQAQTFPSGSHSLDRTSLLPNVGPSLKPHQICGSRYQGTCIPVETFRGALLYCLPMWDFCIFVSFCVFLRESLFKEFTSGENVYFSTFIARTLGLDDSRGYVFSCPL